MPELPEVETIKKSLEPRLVGRTIEEITVFLPKMVRAGSEMLSEAIGEKVTAMERRGKYLFIHLSAKKTLVIHLRMTGQLIYYEKATPPLAHTHVLFGLSGGTQLHFRDTRQFGQICLLSTTVLPNQANLQKLGVEPLEAAFTRDFLRRELGRHRCRIKTLLLDQTFIAGLGNIYADEALHLAGLHPERIAQDLSPGEITLLHRSIRRVLQEGIEHHGTTLRDYVDGTGSGGSYQNYLRVHGREGQNCRLCGTVIKRKKIGGRSAYFCPQCQKT